MVKKQVNSLLRFVPAILWMGFIFYLSSRSTVGIGTTSLDRFLILKTFHLIEYATLAVLLFFAFKKIHFSIIFSYLYALSDEFHQTFVPGRTGKLVDTFIDFTGILIGLFVLKKLLALSFVKKIFN